MHALALYFKLSRALYALCIAVITVSVFAYGALLLGAVAHAAHQTEAQESIKKLSQELGSLEAHYLTQTKELSPERAAALGFVAPISVATVFAPQQTLTLRQE